ncbi:MULTISPECIES: serine hydrolase [Microbacterium]|uniref:Beta-lactamase class A catalytic domain-containing protein n=1 Tax=Microbacterium wangchenii TaxID=2541726 RepID=A0ABX5ST84_9MICO|nr:MULTISPECIES: serine hydrolase [Microbacterium]MCK6066749.1 cell wall-binding repeat-containing protein [Microbacterium sp. EYE_512]QBR88070.1 hypothetical protein E4K62_04780 [Microbacterium wangchenii]TXK18140.1 hypothetical protein FVP99_06020 [Microbacterium wangchenii]
MTHRSPLRRSHIARASALVLAVVCVLSSSLTTSSGAMAAPTPETTVSPPSPSPSATGEEPAQTPSPEPPAPADVEDLAQPPTPSPTPSQNPLAPDRVTPPTDEVPDDRPMPVEPEPRSAPRAVVPQDAVAVPNASRVSGQDRYSTSVAAARNAFPSGAATVLVTAGNAPADAIVAAGLAARLQAPLLYVRADSVPAAVAEELTRLAPEGIVVVGGTGVVQEAVLTQLQRWAPDVRRYGGGDRYESSRLALTGVGGTIDTVYVAGGQGTVDAALASVTAASNGRGVLLVRGAGALDEPTLTALRSIGATKTVIVGGLGTVSARHEQSLRTAGFTVSRLVAPNRYAQSILMAGQRTAPAQRAIVVNSFTDPDLAVAAALAAASEQPLYYAIEPCTPDAVAADISARGVAVTAVGGPAWLGPAVLVNRNCSAEKDLRQRNLNAAIRATTAQYPGSFSVSVRQMDGLGVVTDVNGGVLREPASMMKLYAAWAVLHKIERGEASWGTMLPSGLDLSTCVYVMIHASDNGCHSDIVHWIGIGNLNAFIRASGWSQTTYGSVPSGTSVLYAGNRTTTNDLVLLLDRLHGAKMISRPSADHLLTLMSAQIWRSRIASGIPPGVRQATKPGALWIDSGLLQGDSGVVWGPKSTYVISIVGDQAPPQAALRAISRTVYESFNGSFGTAAWYPVEQMVTVRATALRTSPAGAMTVVVPAGVPIEVLDADRNWYKVRYGNRQLWTVVNDLRNR